VLLVVLVTLSSGLFNIFSVMNVQLPEGDEWLRAISPMAIVPLSRFLSLFSGFALVVSSISLLRRKQRAWRIVTCIAFLALLVHILRGLDWLDASFSLTLITVLLAGKRLFYVKSSVPDLRLGILRLSVSFGVALFYGVVGFWLLDPEHFGVNFHIWDAVHSTMHYMALTGSPEVTPLTRYGRWFSDSLFLIAIVTYTYSGLVIFRPVAYRFYTVPHERTSAATILKFHGRSSLDYFKLWPDKSYFFNRDHDSFVAYRVANGYAVSLGDPSGPQEKLGETVSEFEAFCRENDWKIAFHQTLDEFVPLYKEMGYRKLKIGDCAIVDLTKFSLQGKSYKSLRSRNAQLEKMGIHTSFFRPPIPQNVVTQAAEVSKEWLQIPGRRERTFTLGNFGPDYIKNTEVVSLFNNKGQMLAFVNLPPSYTPGERTIDLMRRRIEAPNGAMDYLFVQTFLWAKGQGYRRFDLGMAPMSGFEEHERSSLEERAIHNFFQRLGFLFSYEGLRKYKGKFANIWEPRYEIYKNVLDLPRLAIAIQKVCAYREDE
jgi:phosphatidylglycerol lysyltransferase